MKIPYPHTLDVGSYITYCVSERYSFDVPSQWHAHVLFELSSIRKQLRELDKRGVRRRLRRVR